MRRAAPILLTLALLPACSSPPPADDPFVEAPELLAARVTREVGATAPAVLYSADFVFQDQLFEVQKRQDSPERCVLVARNRDKVQISLVALALLPSRTRVTLSSGFGTEEEIEALLVEVLDRIR